MSYTCLTLPNHSTDNCDVQLGGLDSIGFLLEDHGITDFSSATQWNAAIAAGTAKIVKAIKGEMPEQTAQEGENPRACGPDNIVDGYNATIKFKDFNVNDDNDEFYTKATKVPFVGMAFHVCDADTIRYTERQVRLKYTHVIPMNNKEKQLYNVEISWYTPAGIQVTTLADEPVSIFN